MPSKNTSRRSEPSKKKATVVEIVVRRGAGRRFDALKKQTSELPVVVSWDRRKTDRRRGSDASAKAARDRRSTDRRQKPPFTWELADFVVVAPPEGKGSATRRKGKKGLAAG